MRGPFPGAHTQMHTQGADSRRSLGHCAPRDTLPATLPAPPTEVALLNSPLLESGSNRTPCGAGSPRCFCYLCASQSLPRCSTLQPAPPVRPSRFVTSHPRSRTHSHVGCTTALVSATSTRDIPRASWLVPRTWRRRKGGADEARLLKIGQYSSHSRGPALGRAPPPVPARPRPVRGC